MAGIKYKYSTSDKIFNIFTFLLMLSVSIVMIYPFLYVLNYSLSAPSKAYGSLLLLPKSLTFDSYIQMFKVKGMPRAITISVLRTVIGAGASVLFSFMAGYVLSKDYLVGSKFFRRFFVFTMYVDAGLIPTYLVYKSLHLTGSFWVYIFPLAVNVFNVILIRTYCESIPPAVEESASLEGANDIIIAFQIILPMAIPVIAAITLFSGIQQWNAFIDTQLYNAMSKEFHTLQYVLYNFLAVQSQALEVAKESRQVSSYSIQSLKMAMTVITVIPILIVYPFIQRYFMSGIMVGSIKG